MKTDLYPKEEYYASAQEFLQEEDLVETDIRIVGWNKKFRIRALTFAQMKQINEKATDKDGNLLDDLFVYYSVIEGVVRPNFILETAKQLAEKNGEAVKELCDQIWAIGRINKKTFDAYIEEVRQTVEEQEKHTHK